MNLGKNLRQIRTAHNISRQQLADTLNLSYSSICKYECGTRTPDFDSLVKIAQFFSVTLDDLLDIRPEDEYFDDNANVMTLPCIFEPEDIYDTAPENDEHVLSEEELYVLELYRNLDSEYKVTINKTLESFSQADKYKSKNKK